jgi:hypothetical protein
MKKLFFVIVLTLIFQATSFLLLVEKVAAASANVNLSVVVRSRLSTETINDFDYSAINPLGEGNIYL